MNDKETMADFNAWAKGKHDLELDNNSEYVYSATRFAFKAWCAAKRRYEVKEQITEQDINEACDYLHKSLITLLKNNDYSSYAHVESKITKVINISQRLYDFERSVVKD